MLRSIVTGIGLLLLVAPLSAEVSNGFDSDVTYAVQGQTSGSAATGTVMYRTKLLPLQDAPNSPSNPWWSIVSPDGTATSGTFKGDLQQSLTFSNAQAAGVNSSAGYRLFLLAVDNLGYPIVQEVDSTFTILREVYVGRIVTGSAGFNAATTVQPSRIRYNAKNNTLMVSVAHDGTGTGGTLHAYIYEFTLPDSPAGTGVNSPVELQGITLMETYDTGLTGANANTGNQALTMNVTPDGMVYFRNQVTNVLSFPSTAGGLVPGGTTSNPTTVVTNATLNAVTGQGLIGTSGQWQAACYQPSSNALINLQRKTGSGGAQPVMVKYDLSTNTASLISGSLTYRGQNDASLDTGTGTVWCASVALPASGNGGLWKYDSSGTLTKWDNAGTGTTGFSALEIDVAIPPSGTGACCEPTSHGGGCVVESQSACIADGGTWQGAASTCAAAPCSQTGACCLSGNSCQVLSQADCHAAGGYWDPAAAACDAGTCAVWQGACCGGCGSCTQALLSECAGSRVWSGAGTSCQQVSCTTNRCAIPPEDADCDGDVDMDDFGVFQLCYNPGGPIPSAPVNCECFDRSGPTPGVPDGVIDNHDFDAIFNPQASDCAKGANVPPGTCP